MPLIFGIYDILLNLFFVLFFPLFFLYSLCTGRYRQGLGERLGIYSSSVKKKLEAGSRRLWIHAVSVGEVRAAGVLISALKDLAPDFVFVLSTTTEQGYKIARERLASEAACLLFPIDTGWAVRRALKLVRPEAVICLETELWPGFIYQVHKYGAKLLLVNGRISVRSFGRYRKIKWFISPLLEKFDYMSVIRKDDADRLMALGANAKRVIVHGNMKFDLVAQDVLPGTEKIVRDRVGIGPDHPVFIAGSTHKGEEELVLGAFGFLRRKYPDLLLIIAPRHVERSLEVECLLKKEGVEYSKWSDFDKAEGGSAILVDQMGPLFELYSIGTIVFCGGSLIPYGGHNIMEAAIWGKVVFYGPHMYDFLDATALLESVGAGVEIRGVRQFVEMAMWCLENPSESQARGLHGKRIIEANKGAARKQAGLIKKVLEAA
ncbi:MAG: 3-deoxy-D-manno-octulosonic acid transferase [Pseudomonadota bacterium]